MIGVTYTIEQERRVSYDRDGSGYPGSISINILENNSEFTDEEVEEWLWETLFDSIC